MKYSTSSSDSSANPVIDKKGCICRITAWLQKADFAWLDSLAAVITGKPKNPVTNNEVELASRGAIIAGLVILFIFFGVFGVWATVAPLESAAVAQGTIVVDSNKKTIQHLEGGIITEILVRDGSKVEEGQPLIRLSETSAKARQALLTTQIAAAKAMEARLFAERDGISSIAFPQELLAKKEEPDIAEVMDAEVRLFETRTKSLSGKISILNQRIAQLNDQINGMDAQAVSVGSQLKLINQEIGVVDKLLKDGNAQLPRLLALQRQAAELGGNRGEYAAQIARARQAITEAELEIINAKNQHLSEVIDQLRQTQANLSDLQEREKASADILDRIVITAPKAGTVTDLKFHTVGGVIAPGATIMDIIPLDDTLVIDGKVSPQDIQAVHKGLLARVRLTAFKARKTPILEGEVVHVSADRLIDDATRLPYFRARVTISKEELARLGKGHELSPGMPADVLIVTGKRTFLGYLFDPITDYFAMSFNEQ